MQNLVTPIMAGDLSCLSRLLLTFQRDKRYDVAANVIERAIIANAHRKDSGQLHPDYGNGSIMQAAREFGRELPAEPRYDDVDYIDATMTALLAVKTSLKVSQLMAAE